MGLRDFIKPRNTDLSDNEEFIEQAIQTFERNIDKYSGKSLAWQVRITAEDLNIRASELMDILDKYYETKE